MPHLLAIGGGGFLAGTDPELDAMPLELSGKDAPRIGFLPTASGDLPSDIDAFYQAFPHERATHFSLFHRTRGDLARRLLAQDVLYVGGGSTVNLLAVWRAHGLPELLRRAYDGGTVLAGVSAGAACWFEGVLTDAFGPPLQPWSGGLGWLAGSCCPHWSATAPRHARFRQVVREGFPGGVGIGDGVALHFVDGQLARAVSPRADGEALHLALEGNRLVETPISIEPLGRTS